MEAFRELHRAVRVSGAARTGTDGALFPTEFFADEAGDLVAFVPVAAVPDASAGAGHGVRGARSRLAVTTFDGPPLDLDRAYGAVGRWVVDQATSSRVRSASATSRPATRTTCSPTPPRCAGR